MNESNKVRLRPLNEADTITTDQSMTIKPKRPVSPPEQDGMSPDDQSDKKSSPSVLVPTSSSNRRF